MLPILLKTLPFFALIGLGYLTATGALSDIGHKIMGAEGEVMPVESPAPAAPAPAHAP